MAKYYYYSITVIISLFIIASCAPESTPTGNDAVYQLNVTVDPSEAGTVTPGSTELTEGDEVEITASPNEGWVFDRWQGDHTGSDNPVTITMDRDKDILALFIKKEDSLTITIEGEGTVSERVVQNNNNDYSHGTTVELTANPSDGWIFDRWEGDLTGSDNPSQIEVTEAKEVTAIFVRKTYQISVSVEGEGSMTETLISGTGEEGVYEFNSVVELSASPSDGWRFSHWTGDVDGSTNPVSVEMDSDKNVTAVFEQRSYDLTILIEGEGTVSEEVVEEGKMVKITATAASGWIFDRWEGDLTGSENPSEVDITTEKEITAIFKKGHFALNIEVNGYGSVQKALQSGNESGGLYELGSEVRLTASAQRGWRFDHWSGDASGDTNPVTITIGVNNNVTATFVRQAFSLSTNTEGEGSVGRTLQSGSESNGEYESGSVVELAATPASGWEFSHWTGDVTGSENPAQITMNSNKSVTAVFEQESFSLSTNTEGEGSVGRTLQSGSESNGEYESGSVVELTAAPASDWQFSHWEHDLSGDQNPQTITMDTDKTVTAVFEEKVEEEYKERDFEGMVQSVDAEAGTFTLVNGLTLTLNSDSKIEDEDFATLEEVVDALAQGILVEAVGKYYTNDDGVNIVIEVKFEAKDDD